MGRKLGGGLQERRNADGSTSYYGRFWAYGKRRRVLLGHNPPRDGEPAMNRERAQELLDYLVAQVRHGDWVPEPDRPEPPPQADAPSVPTIQELATEYLRSRAHKGPKGEGVQTALGLLRLHVLPWFGELTPDQVTIQRVEAFIEAKTAEREKVEQLRARGITTRPDGRPLPRGCGPLTINRAVRKLYAVMDYGAVRYETPSAERLKLAQLLVRAPYRPGPHLTCEQLQLLFQAGQQLDREAFPGHRHVGRHAILATLALTGLRLGELAALRLRDLDRTRWLLQIPDAKTPTGVRSVVVVPHLRPILEEHIGRYRAEAPLGQAVFATASGQHQRTDNLRKNVWAVAHERALKLAASRHVSGPPAEATPHALRRSYITHMLERGEPVHWVMAQVGHKDSAVTMEVYARVEAYRHNTAPDPLLETYYRVREENQQPALRGAEGA